MHEELSQRNLPVLFDAWPAGDFSAAWEKRKKELLQILEENVYGKTPPPPSYVGSELLEHQESALAGNAVMEKRELSFMTPKGIFSFPFYLLIPNGMKKPPVLLYLSFHRDIWSPYLPLEEITDQGFAVAFFCYHDAVPDTCDGQYDQGLAEKFLHGGPRYSGEWGKIGMWAYAASRVMDILFQRDDLDTAHISVAGHSRLGKTALWCMAQDERFYAAFSNDSGFGGAALAKGGTGEKIQDFLDWGSCDWFCPAFQTFVGREQALPFDQHFLLALCAPRHIYVGSASEDESADPKSEFLACCAVSPIYEALGKKGLAGPDRYPLPGEYLHDGALGYHLRPGAHYLSRHDWNGYIRFIRRKIEEEEDGKAFRS